MTLTINAIDNQFATATGSNYDSHGHRSDFDTPIEDNSNLSITSNPGDTGPYLFSLGDTYDLTWDSGSGPMSMQDAEVVRSDLYSGHVSQGIVVFEGTDQNGDATQVVWTENLNVHQWYYDNFNGPNPPVFWNTDQNSTTYGYICFEAHTRIETPAGPIRAGALQARDWVLTRDSGVQRLRWVGRRLARGTGCGVPVRFEPGALGNREPFGVSLQHRVLLDGAEVLALTGGEEVLAPAKGLLGHPGIRAAPKSTVAYVNFLCDRHEIVTAAGGAACESLYLGGQARKSIAQGAQDPLADYPGLAAGGADSLPQAGPLARRVLSVRETRDLVARLGGAGLVGARGSAGPCPAGPKPLRTPVHNLGCHAVEAFATPAACGVI